MNPLNVIKFRGNKLFNKKICKIKKNKRKLTKNIKIRLRLIHVCLFQPLNNNNIKPK